MPLIDTSLLAAYFCPEPLSAVAQRALAKASPRLITPLVEVELVSALAIKVRTRQIDTASARKVLAEFERQQADAIFLRRSLEDLDYRQAYEWLTQLQGTLRTADALHLASAARLGEPLWTADGPLAKEAARLAVACRLFK